MFFRVPVAWEDTRRFVADEVEVELGAGEAVGSCFSEDAG